jgi:hypothetical protein
VDENFAALTIVVKQSQSCTGVGWKSIDALRR